MKAVTKGFCVDPDFHQKNGKECEVLQQLANILEELNSFLSFFTGVVAVFLV